MITRGLSHLQAWYSDVPAPRGLCLRHRTSKCCPERSPTADVSRSDKSLLQQATRVRSNPINTQPNGMTQQNRICSIPLFAVPYQPVADGSLARSRAATSLSSD
jgi:hypothetical protein